ncbi:Helix-turn-helix [Parageobacillus thermantarcticus]|uniref:Helix-turn-helix n=1 Tax=Parageobacillus thermantarcticus TaxID=186116 RepID=A0A1I0TYZ3_9BACL|nr:helix-turn-helix transcriptional regulator [Parageobacillus thermantarcticus]SFA57081.1 Helix-turn-helix [Parageobacillus thermantarcticus]
MRNLLDTSKIVETHPDLHEQFYGLGAILAQIIFRKRMEKNMTQQELAQKAGVGVKTISRVEGGSGNIEIKTYEKLFQALGLSNTEIGHIIVEIEEKNKINHYV